MTAYALGLDLGTSGLRTAVLNREGRVLSTARAHYGATPEAARDATGWWTGARACLLAQMEALRSAGHDPTTLRRIAVDGTSGSVVLTDAALRPVSHALMYDDAGLDTEAALIARHAPARHVANGPGSALARALHLYDQTGQHAAHLLHQADFIAAKLTGHGGVTDYNNALKTGLDPASGTWPDWMQELPLPPSLLPRALPPGARLAPVLPAIAQEFGLSPKCAVHMGTTDSIAAFLAASAAVPGAAVTSLGTTLAVKLCARQRVDAPEMGLYAHRLGDLWLLGGASNSGGGVLARFFTGDQLASLSSRIDPAVESPLDYYPLPRPGERFPVNDPGMAPRLSPRPADDAVFLHGLLEGIARIEKRAYDLLVQLGAAPPSRILTAGGGAANPVWTAIRARVLSLPVMAADDPDAAVGVARLAISG